MKKRWLSLTLALVFCLSLVPGVTMTAGAATSYNLFLGDVEVTSENAADILEDGGSASYNDATKTLTLNNCVLNGVDTTNRSSWISCNGDPWNLTIELIGQNALIDNSSQNNGIDWYLNQNISLTFTGSGSLVVSGGNRTNTTLAAIMTDNLILDDDFTGTLIATGGSATGGYSSSGVQVKGITVKCGTLIATGGPTESYGASSGIYVESGSGTLTVSGGVLIAQGGNAASYGSSYGVYRSNNSGTIKIDGGAVVMRAGLVDNGLSGTRQACNGTVTATGMQSFTNGAGAVYVPNDWTAQSSEAGFTLTGDALTTNTCYVSTSPSNPVTSEATTINTGGHTLLAVNLGEGTTSQNVYGLNLSGQNVSISGGGKVIAVGGISGYSCGLYHSPSTSANVSFTASGTEVLAVAGPSQYINYGARFSEDVKTITLQNAANFVGAGGPSSSGSSYGVYTGNQMKLNDTSQVIGVGNHAGGSNSYSVGVIASTLDVTANASLLCVGGSGDYSFGLWQSAFGQVSATLSGKCTALGGIGKYNSSGINFNSYGTATVNDGAKVLALGSTATDTTNGNSSGFYSSNANVTVTVNGGDFRAAGRTAAFRSSNESSTVHEGPSARKLEKAGYVSERCEINRQIRADNTLIRTLKAAVQKMKSVIETTIPAIANAMETVRQNLIIFNYGLLHVTDRRRETGEYITRATVQYKDYLDLSEQIKEKTQERDSLQKELAALSMFSIGRRRGLTAKSSELSEAIEELRFEEQSVIQAFGKVDAAGMKKVRGEISEAESDLAHYDKRAGEITAAINREKNKFTVLKEQASVLDPGELTDARLALRPQKENAAREHVRKATTDGRINFWNYQCSVRETDALLGEEGMEKQREYEKLREAWDYPREVQRKPKEVEHNR